MTDFAVPLKGVDGTHAMLAKDNGNSMSFYHAEDTTQRATLLAALGAIHDAVITVDGDTIAQLNVLKTICTALTGTLPISVASLPMPMGAATNAKLESVRLLLANTLAVSAASLPLPTGAATEMTLDSVRKLIANTLAVSVASLPLPAGAAQAAKQVDILNALTTGTFAVSIASQPLPAGAATDVKLEEVRALLAQANTPAPDPVFDHLNGKAVAATTSTLLIATPTGCKAIRISSDADAYVNTAGAVASDGPTSIRIFAGRAETIPVPPGTNINVAAVTGTANVRATPLKSR